MSNLNVGTVPVEYLPVEYYVGILTSMYSQTNQFKQWSRVVLGVLDDISNCLLTIDSAFDLDYAIGVQLDTLGVEIGASRIVPFQPSSGVSPILDDDTYRILLKATRANNMWDGKIGSLYSTWADLFPGGHIAILDNQNMTAYIIMTGSFSSIIQDLVSHDMIVPRPQAVAYTFLYGDLPFFGFSTSNNAFIAGFGVGKWS